ncbi:hypothetical protein HTZ84_14215 [Haloterrigena sp. SYSU A558-1]|uniref:Uncharacterized protein n=1 Tax=Haloterrigena gelatinilytica TaxID=2741724 RepID=A0A8J8GLX1_9EURY|nr:hypothetical protein [Haloterrigena gelatinilytica]NUB90727.1 hypothetical protein [Haloterrigena gelatinilytica]NUC73455.1 hypothetical protein [Haloterrigena gelatinilytica]
MSESDGSASEETSNTMVDRVRGGRAMLWFLVEGNRALVAGVMLAVSYTLLVVLGTFGPGSIAKLFNPAPIASTFTPTIIGIIMGVTLVLTFNQFVLAEELGPVADQRERMAGAMEFRRDTEDAVDRTTSPPEPSAFLRGLVEATGDRADELLDALESDPDLDEAAREDVREYAEGIAADAERVADNLEGKQFGRFEVVKAALEYNYSWKIYTGNRVRNHHEEALPDAIDEQLDELLEVLSFFGPAREHFKTLYFRWEIITLSRSLAYLSLPALAVSAYMILVFEVGDVAGVIAGIDQGLLFVALAFAVGVTPFAIFLSYILRIVTVAKWTLAIGPFILRETDRGEDVGWE